MDDNNGDTFYHKDQRFQSFENRSNRSSFSTLQTEETLTLRKEIRHSAVSITRMQNQQVDSPALPSRTDIISLFHQLEQPIDNNLASLLNKLIQAIDSRILFYLYFIYTHIYIFYLSIHCFSSWSCSLHCSIARIEYCSLSSQRHFKLPQSRNPMYNVACH